MEKLLKIISKGIFIGLILFVTSYWGIYFMVGSSAFEQEILNASNIKIFTGQVITSSIIGIFIYFLIAYIKYVAIKLKENEKQTDMKKSVKDTIKYSFLLIILLSAIMLYVEKMSNVLGENIGKIMLINIVAGLSILCLIYCVKVSIEELIINKKIKEKNKE